MKGREWNGSLMARSGHGLLCILKACISMFSPLLPVISRLFLPVPCGRWPVAISSHGRTAPRASEAHVGLRQDTNYP